MALLFGGSTAILLIGLLALACLVLACVTPPASRGFALAAAEDIVYGMLGYCNLSTNECVVGTPFYTVSDLTSLQDWKMDGNARDTLAKILIIIPVAAFLTLVTVFFNFLGHFRSAGLSSAFNIIRMIVATLTFLASAVAVIITFLLFYPHVKWPSWLLIPAAVWNLINMPLTFYVLRVSPDENEENSSLTDEDKYDSNLTDLTVNDQFKSLDFTKNPHSINVITTDSASTNGLNNRRDLNKANGNLFNAPVISDVVNEYPRPSLELEDSASTASGTAPQATHSVINEGTPNIISPQNYGRANAAISEAPSFQPRAVKPEMANTPSHYNTTTNTANSRNQSHYTPKLNQNIAQYQPQNQRSQRTQISNLQTTHSQNPTYPTSLPLSKPSYGTSSSQPLSPASRQPWAHSTIQPDGSVSLKPSKELNPDSYGKRETSSSIYTADPLQGLAAESTSLQNPNTNVHGDSNHDAIMNEYDFENSSLNDDLDSDFTSVSQRPANPQYYKSLQKGPSAPEKVEQQAQMYNNQPVFQPQYDPSYQFNTPPPPQQFNSQYQKYPQGYQRMPLSNDYPPQKTHNVTPRDNADMVLSFNPDFALTGPAFQSKPSARNTKPTQNPSGGYKPAYKRSQGTASSKLGAASTLGDSPYNFK